MKIKLLILAISISLLNIMCCGNDGPYKTYKFQPAGKIDLINTDDRFINIKDTIKGKFHIKLEFETEDVFVNNYSIIPTAMATSCDYVEPYPLNNSNIDKLSISINKSFSYKSKEVSPNTNIFRLDENHFFYIENRYNPNYVVFDEKFLYYAKFEKGWTTFTISGELEDGQKFNFEKEIYLDL